MSPFIFIHRTLRWAAWGVVLLACVWLYQQRQFLDPAVAFGKTIWLKDWENRKEIRETEGIVTKAINDTTFQLKESSGKLFNIQLAALSVDPDYRYPSEEAVYYDLKEMLVSNRVRVVCNYFNEKGAAIGVAHLGETNVNASLITTGKVIFERDQATRLPLIEQFQMRLADRRFSRRDPGQ